MDDLWLVRKHEGLRTQLYDDATGKPLTSGSTIQGTPTNGYGFNMLELFPEEIAFMLDTRVRQARNCVRAMTLDAAPGVSDARQAVLVDMAYELGARGLSQFVHFIAAVRAGDWEMAAKEIENSKLQSEAPSRVEENAAILRSGVWPGQPVAAAPAIG